MREVIGTRACSSSPCTLPSQNWKPRWLDRPVSSALKAALSTVGELRGSSSIGRPVTADVETTLSGPSPTPLTPALN